MQREAKNCRKQHFQYGQVPFSSRDNTFIYSVPKVKSKSKIPVLKRKPRSTTKNHFIYGRSEDSETASSGLQQERNLIKQKTTIIRNKASLKIDAREEYEKFQERKKKLAADTKQEKKKDFELLKTYNPPWNGNGTGNENTKTKVKELALEGFELQQCFGKPGCGAPLRNEAGIVKTTKSVDPETRFQKRDRSQIFGLEEPRNCQRVKDPPKSSINILGQPNIYGFLMKKDVSRSSYDILGAPRVKERKGKKGKETKEITSEPVEKIIKHVKIKRKGLNDGIQIHDKQKAFVPLDCVETAVSTNKDKCDTNPGIRNTSVFRMYDPWGRSGGGGPKYDKEGNVVAQKMNIVKDEILPSFKTESQKEINFLGQTVGNDRKDNVKNGNYYRAPTYTKGIVSLDKRRSILPGETIEEFKERQENLNGGKVDNFKTELNNKNINHETKHKIQNNLKPPHSSDTPDRVKTKHDKARNMANEDPKDYGQNEGIASNAVPELPDIHGYVPSAQEINTNKSMVDKIMEPENSVVKAQENSATNNNEHREDFSKSAVSNEIKKEIQPNQRTDINKAKVSQKTKENPVLSNAIKRKLGKVKQPR